MEDDLISIISCYSEEEDEWSNEDCEVFFDGELISVRLKENREQIDEIMDFEIAAELSAEVPAEMAAVPGDVAAELPNGNEDKDNMLLDEDYEVFFDGELISVRLKENGQQIDAIIDFEMAAELSAEGVAEMAAVHGGVAAEMPNENEDEDNILLDHVGEFI
jgi:hypothetical protein